MDVKASSARLHAWAVLPNVHLWPNPEWLGIARTQLFITERYSSCHKQGLQGGREPPVWAPAHWGGQKGEPGLLWTLVLLEPVCPQHLTATDTTHMPVHERAHHVLVGGEPPWTRRPTRQSQSCLLRRIRHKE